MSEPFEPRILAFLCNWCSYAGADLAGVSRYQYPPTIRIMRTMCSGRVDPLYLLEGLKNGFDAVFVFGCHIGDCHYLDGNLYTMRRVAMVRDLMDYSGIGSERVQLRWVSAAEGQQFAQFVTELTEQIQALGPFRLEDHGMALNALDGAFNSQRLRWVLGMERQLTELGNVYGGRIDEEKYHDMLRQVARTEYDKALILDALKTGPLSVRGISGKSGLPVYTVSQLLSDMERAGQTEFHQYEGTTPTFASLVG